MIILTKKLTHNTVNTYFALATFEKLTQTYIVRKLRIEELHVGGVKASLQNYLSNLIICRRETIHMCGVWEELHLQE